MVGRVLLGVAMSLSLVVVTVGTPSAPLTPTAAIAASTGFVGVTPARLLDTRDGTGAPAAAIGPGGIVDLQVTGRGGVPDSGVSAVVLNVTVTEPTVAGYVTVFPTGSAQPTASNLNFVPGETVPNLVIAKIGSGGRVSLFNSAGTTHLVADVSGYYTTGSQLVPTVPIRLLDTRDSTGGVTGPTFGKVDVVVLGHAGVPANATSVVLNVTVTEPTGDGYLTVWPAGAAQPIASNLNFVHGQTVPNLVISKIGTEGKISYFNNSGKVHVVMDVLGYLSNPVSMAEVLDKVDYNDSSWREAAVPVQGAMRSNSLTVGGTCSTSVPLWAEYNLGRQWGTLATTLSFADTTAATSKMRFRILGDNAVLVDQTLSFGQAIDVTANVANVLRVRFEVVNANPSTSICSFSPVFADVRLLSAAGQPFPDPPEFFPLVPSRILDTRDGTGAAKGRVAGGGTIDLQVLGHGGVPTSGVGAVVMNLTVTQTDVAGFLTAWPSGVDRPLASNVNFVSGDTVPNLVIVPVGAGGRVSIFNSAGFSHVIADVLGWYPGAVTSEPSTVNMTEILDKVDYNDSSWREATIPVQGISRFNSLTVGGTCSITVPLWAEYNLSRHWGTLTTTLSFADTAAAASKMRFRILGDNVVLVDQTLTFGQAVDVTANVSNVLRVRFEVVNANATTSTCSYSPVFASPLLDR